MSQLEDQLSSLLARSADAVEVHPDITRVVEASPMIPLTGPGPRPSRGVRGRRWPVVVAGAAAAACVVAGALVATVGDFRDPVEVGPSTDSSEPDTEVDAAGVTRYLVTAPGWVVTDVDESSGPEYGGHVGELGLTDGTRMITLNWYPADQYDNYINDRQNGAESTSHTTIAGHDALVFDEGSRRTVSAWWLEGDNVFGMRGDNIALDEYLAVVATVREVDQETWLAALPAGTVTPEDRAAAVEATLAELPVPDGLDVDALIATGTANDAHSVELEVTNAVICGWVQQWVDGTASGDSAAVDEATGAMTSSREWPPLIETASGTMREFVWDVADAMAAGLPLEQYPYLPQGTGYERHLGCPESPVEGG
jgi:hypothetical protein